RGGHAHRHAHGGLRAAEPQAAAAAADGEERMTRAGFFAGSFDPPTLGHLDLVARARGVVDRLVVGVGVKAEKAPGLAGRERVVGVGINAEKSPWLPVEERLALLRELVPAEVEVVAFDGLAVQAARRAGATLLLRGVRGEADLATELPMALANRRLAPELET